MAWQTDEAIEELFSKRTIEEECKKFSSNKNKKKRTSKKSITSSSSSDEARLRSEGRMDYESYMI